MILAPDVGGDRARLQVFVVAAVTGGDAMSLQGKLLQSRPGDAPSTARARVGRYGGLVKQAPAVRCIRCNGHYAQTRLRRRFTLPL
jgi:hypothetical protein